MEFIIADTQLMELGFLQTSKATIDIDLGDTNDFEITMDLDEWTKNPYSYDYLFYANETEYGGIIEDIKVDTKANTIKLLGYTWRGLLTQKIIVPPTGMAYLSISGEANATIKSIIASSFGDLFVVDDVDSGYLVNYQFDRYVDMLTGFTKMLKTVGAKLKIYFDNQDMMVHLQAVAIEDYSDDLEYSQDNKINFTTRDYRRGINHLICLGKGELTEREVIHLYLQSDGTIGSNPFYRGLEERVATYDYSSAEDTSALIEGGTARFRELLNYTELAMTIDDVPAEIGDIVGGRERVTGLYMKKPISQKILQVSKNKETVSFKVGD